MHVALLPISQTLLSDKSYDIEFHGFLTNHVKHAVVALNGLQADPNRIQAYWDFYTRQTPYGLTVEPVRTPWNEVTPATLKEWKDWRGKKIHWQELVLFIHHQILDTTVNLVVSTFAPDLLSGLVGGLTHGIIHLGWALDAQSPWMVAEGLAHLNFCHVGVDETTLEYMHTNDETPMDSFIRVAQRFQQEKLQTEWVDRVKRKYNESFHPELVQAGFQWHVAKLMYEPHSIVIQIPNWVHKDPSKMWVELYKAVTWIYLATRDGRGHGNFFVLHLLTSLWAVEQVCAVCNEPRVTSKALTHFYASAVTLLSAGGFPTSEALINAREEIPSCHLDDETYDWKATVNAAIAEEEEHNAKLVYVTRELWKRYDRWSGFSQTAGSFTLTPNIGPSGRSTSES